MTEDDPVSHELKKFTSILLLQYVIHAR